MTLGYRINENGSTEVVNYDLSNMSNRFQHILTNRGVGDISIIESWIIGDKFYIIYSWNVGYNNFNRFDFSYTNAYGDAFIMAIDRNEDIIDIVESDINNHFQGIDINVSTDNSEEDDSYDSYDYNDGFLVREDDGVYDDGDIQIDFMEIFSDDE